MTDERIATSLDRLESAFRPTSEALDLVAAGLRRRRRTRRVGAAAAAVVATVAIVVGTTSAMHVTRTGPPPAGATSTATPSGTPSPSDPDAPPFEMWSAEAEHFANRVSNVAHLQPEFSGAAYDYEGHRFLVYGTSAQPPGPVAGLLAKAPDGVELSWVQVDYSEQDLAQALKVVMQQVDRAVEGYFERDYSGVVVGLKELPDTDSALEDLQRQAGLVTDVPVRFKAGDVIAADLEFGPPST